MTICICGGGNLGHILAGYISAKKKFTVNLLTQKPRLWHHNLFITDCNHKIYQGCLNLISDKAQEVIPQSDIILLCVPGFAIEDELLKIRPYLDKHHVVGSIVSSTGFFFIAHKILPDSIGLFGFQGVPFISRIDTYGQSASLLGYKKELKLSTEFIPSPDLLINSLREMLDTPIHLVSHYLEVTLSNSNPLLHPSRLYNLFKDYKPGQYYSKHFLFYEEWDDNSSTLLIDCDREFSSVLKKLPVHTDHIIPLLDYYESKNSISLTRKIRSIEAFKGIKTPMKYIHPQKYIPDFNNRYFTEDFPFGISIIKQLAVYTNTPTPCIDKIITWGNKFIPSATKFEINI